MEVKVNRDRHGIGPQTRCVKADVPTALTPPRYSPLSHRVIVLLSLGAAIETEHLCLQTRETFGGSC